MTDPFGRVAGRRRDTADSLEVQRIVRLPVVELPTHEVVEALSREVVDAAYFEPPHSFRLHPEQAGAILSFDLYDGVFGPIGVGKGKTLITLLIADRAFARGESSKSMILVPSQVYEQLTKIDLPRERRRVGLRVPFLLMGGRAARERRALARSGKVGCYVLPYSLLSTKDSEEVLQAIAPDLLILDEAHNVKNVDKSARAKRLMRYVSQHHPKMVALSGTITSKSIADYHHLIAHALRENCPLPLSGVLAQQWGIVLDSTANPSDAQTGPITPLVQWARRHFPGERLPADVPGFRKAYRLRLNTAPGVVSSGDAELGVSLVFQNQPAQHDEAEPSFARLKKLMDDVEELWRTPSGDEIEYGFHKWRHLYELSTGFYYNLRWPTPEEVMARQSLSLDEAEASLVAAQAHHAKQQEYHKALRQWLDRTHVAGMDTPLLVASEMARSGAERVGDDLYAAWRAAKDLEFDHMPERISEPVRVCDYKVRHAVAWAREHAKHGGMVWFHHDDVGRWLHEAMQEAGLDPVWCPSESVRKGSNGVVMDPANAARLLVVAMGGHGTGKNLQHHQHQLLMQFPRKADLLEQVVGRTHRHGQQADELVVHTTNTLAFDHLNAAACLVDSLYIHQTTGTRQKAIYATYDPLPRIYPPDFLRERGFVDVAMLDAEARAALEDKFGPLEKV